MISVNIKSKEVMDWLKEAKDLKKSKGLFLTVAGEKAKEFLQQEAKEISTTGELHASITAKTIGDKTEIWGSNYATAALETGRAKGKMPPIGALKRWARLKLGDENLAFAVAKKIAKEGTKKHQTGRPRQLTRAVQNIEKWIDKEAVKFLKDLE